jgi:hypothetical protein
MRNASLLTAVLVGLLTTCAEAQRYRYVDQSGNIHFVDSWKQVPREYREQIVPATPTPVLDEKTIRERQRQRDQAARLQRSQIEKEQQRREKERRKLERKREQAAQQDDDTPRSERRRRQEDDIETIN